ncbi:hypothetical protein [Nocardia sp. NPDC057272]|uniref:hypothetical protein n=1 Tax=Nocardia sp. NPDC057272 TaxID=3346079 RepID=UPI0036350536
MKPIAANITRPTRNPISEVSTKAATTLTRAAIIDTITVEPQAYCFPPQSVIRISKVVAFAAMASDIAARMVMVVMIPAVSDANSGSTSALHLAARSSAMAASIRAPEAMKAASTLGSAITSFVTSEIPSRTSLSGWKPAACSQVRSSMSTPVGPPATNSRLASDVPISPIGPTTASSLVS